MSKRSALPISVFAALVALFFLGGPTAPVISLNAQTGCTSTTVPQAPANLRILSLLNFVATLHAQSTSCWPDATNTGYRHAPGYPGSLTKWAGGAIKSNTTYNFIDFGVTDVGSASAPVSNVTFYGCRFKGIAVNEALVKLYGDNITFDYTSFEPGVSAPPTPFSQSYQYGIAADSGYYTFVKQLTVTHSDFWGFGNAIDVDGSTQAKPQVFRHNWIHDAADDGGQYHTDGLGIVSDSGQSSYVVIDHNTIESRGNTNGLAFQRGTYDHFTVTNNLFGGFGFTVTIWASSGSSNITFTDNTFSTRVPVIYGPLYPQPFHQTPGSLWRRNKWMVPTGAAWGSATHNGWYWIPSDAATSGSDTAFVSLVDYAQ